MHEALHVVLPGQVARRAMPLACETVDAFLARNGWSTSALPTICTINGAPVMRAEWATRMIGPQDRLAFVSRPMGPGSGGAQSKQVLGLVAMIGLSLILPGAIPAAWGMAGTLIKGAVMLGGAFLVSTLVNVNAGGDTSEDAGTVYSFGQQRNSARILQPIAARYGRTKSAPAYAAVPWAEYIGNDQYLNILAVRGVGRYDTETIEVDDTVLWTKAGGIASGFTGVKIEFYEPGQEITLFPLNVSTAAEVSGQELSEEWAGGFVSAAAGTTTTALAVDFAAPGGLRYVDAQGNIIEYMVNVFVQFRPVNAQGLPAGDWATLTNPLLRGASKSALRWSFKQDVSPGRYEVRVRRAKHPLDDDANSVHTIVWMGLRAFLTGPKSFADVSTIALRLKATQQLTDASAQNIRDISTRILPVFNGATWVDQPTRNPAWAFWDMATNTRYGAKRAPSKVDAQAVWQLAQLADARGDRFDFEFSSAVSVPEAFDTALSAVRAKHRWSGDTLTLVRDQWQAVPSMLLTDRETVRGTFKADYEFLPSDGVDAIIAEYVDQDTWQVEEVQYPPDYVASYPKRVELRGIVQRAQAYREAGFLFRQSQYRRISPSLETEHDGRLIALGDHVLIQSDMPGAWGAAGAVVARTGNTLTLEPPPKWESGKDHYISLRSKTGGAFGPVKCARGSDDALCVLNAADLALVEANQGMALAAVLFREDGAELPTYAHGVGQSWQRRCIALSGAPSGDRVALSFVMDDPRVHDDDGIPDPLPSMPPMAIPTAPQVAGLIAQLQQNVMEPVLSASWWPAAGATLYRARVSYDGGEGWLSLPDVRGANELSAVVQPAALILEVCAVGKAQGAWARVVLEAPVIDAGNIPVGGGTLEGVLGQVETEGRKAAADLQEVTDRMAMAIANIDAASKLKADKVWQASKTEVERVGVRVESAEATIEQVRTVSASATASLAEEVKTAKATADAAAAIGGQNASKIDQVETAFVDANNALTSRSEALESAVGKKADGSLVSISGTYATQTALAGLNNAVTQQKTDLQAEIGDVAASVNLKATSAVLPTGAVAAYQVAVKVGTSSEFASAGWTIAVSGSAGNWTGAVYVDADKFYVRQGTTSAPVFTLSSGTLYLNGNLIANGSITAAKISAGSLSAISANIGEVTAGIIRSQNGKMIVNLNDGWLGIWS